MTSTTTLLPVAAAAPALGISISALRRGLKSGRYRGQRQGTKQGFTWMVEVPDDRVGGAPGRQPVDRVGDVPHPGAPSWPTWQTTESSPPPQAPPPSSQPATLAQRAHEMAAYSQQLLAPYVHRIEEQAEEIGHLKAELEQARTQLAERERAQAETPGDAPEWPERRSWWQRFVWG